MRRAAVTICFLTPLALAPHLLFYYDVTPKIIVVLLGAAVALALAAFSLDSLRAFWGTPQGQGFTLAILAFMAITAISAGLSADQALAWNGSNWRGFGAVTQCAVVAGAWVLAAFTRAEKRRMLPILQAVCAAGTLAAAYGILQYFGWDPILSPEAYQVGEGPFRIVRPPSTLGHSDYFAAFLLWPVFVGIGLSRKTAPTAQVGDLRHVGGAGPRPAPGRGPRRLGALSATTGATAILLSGSRGALLGLAVGALFFVLIARPRLRTLAVAAAAVAILVSTFYVSPAGARLRARTHWISEDPAGGARILLWRDSLRMSASRPWAGFGPEQFVAQFPRFESVALARAYPDFYHESPHNLWLDTLVSQGAAGLLAQLAAAACALLAGIRALRTRPELALPLLCAFLAAMAAHQFVVLTAANALYFYLGAALLVSLSAGEKPLPPASPRVKMLVLAGGATAAVVLTLAAARLLAVDVALGSAQRLLDAGDTGAAAASYRQAVEGRIAGSSGISADLYFSRRWAKAALETSDVRSRLYLSQLAAGAASLATQHSEGRQNAWYNVAELAASRGDTAVVETALRSAISAAPNWFKPHWALARLLSLEGRLADAVPEARTALELDAGKDLEVNSTMAQILSSADTSR